MSGDINYLPDIVLPGLPLPGRHLFDAAISAKDGPRAWLAFSRGHLATLKWVYKKLEPHVMIGKNRPPPQH